MAARYTRSAPKLAPSTTLAGEASGAGAELLPAGQKRRFAKEENFMSIEKSWIEVVNGSLKGSIALPSGEIEIVGVTWRENDASAFRLFRKDHLSDGEVGACWNWAGDARRSIMVTTFEGRHYGRLTMIEQTGNTARYSLDMMEEAGSTA